MGFVLLICRNILRGRRTSANFVKVLPPGRGPSVAPFGRCLESGLVRRRSRTCHRKAGDRRHRIPRAVRHPLRDGAGICRAARRSRMDEETERSFTRRKLGLAVCSDVRGIVVGRRPCGRGGRSPRFASCTKKILFRVENPSTQFDPEFGSAFRTGIILAENATN